jgi:hypothetical protein
MMKTRQRISEPGDELPEVIAGGGEDRVDGVTLGAFEEASSHTVLALGVADGRFDRGAPE